MLSGQVIPGNTAVVDPTKPFSQLSNFGNVFLQRFECSMLPCVVLSVRILYGLVRRGRVLQSQGDGKTEARCVESAEWCRA